VYYVRAKDSAGTTLESVIDSSADSTAVGTIATGTGAGQVYQGQLGEYSTSLDDIVEIELAIEGGDADATWVGFNLERESEWQFGSREFKNSDDEIETETVVEPTGEFSITELSTLPDVFASGPIADVKAAIAFRAADLETDMRRARWGDAEPYDYPHRLETLVGFKPKTAYALSYANGRAEDEVLFPDTRYNAYKFARRSELPTWNDVDDENVSWTDRTDQFENGSIGADVELTPSVASDEMFVAYSDVLLEDSQKETATSPSGGSAAGAMSGGGGFFGSAWSIVLTMMAAAGTYFAAVKGKIPGF
jgi:hypothetical protein